MNTKQQRFADEYLKDYNATQAAIRSGYSRRTAEQIGFQLLKKTSVADYVKSRCQTIADKLGIDAEYVLSNLKQIGQLTKPTRQEANPAVSLKAFEFLGKHLRLFEENDKKQSNITINVVQF